MQQGLLVEFSCNPHYEITTSAVPASSCYNRILVKLWDVENGTPKSNTLFKVIDVDISVI